MKTANACKRCQSAPPSSPRTVAQILDQARKADPRLRPAVLEIIVEHLLCMTFGVCHPCGRDAARAALPPTELAKGGVA